MTTTPPSTSPRAALVVACLALFTDMFVYGLAIPVLPLLPSVVAAGPAATGVLFGSYAVAMIVATPPAGRLVDRYGPRTPLLAGMVGLAAALLAFAVGGPLWLLLLARVAQGFAGGMAWVASMSLIAAVTPVAKRGPAFGLALSVISIGFLIGPPVAGALAGAFGPAAPFLAGALVAVADGVLRVVLVRPVAPSTDDSTGPAGVLRVPGSGSVAVAVAVGAAITAAVEPVLPPLLAQRFGTDPTGIGLLFAVSVLTGTIANLVAGRYAAVLPQRLLLVGGAALGVLALALVGAGSTTGQVGVGMAALGVAGALVLLPTTLVIHQQGAAADPPTVGGAYALLNLAFSAGMALGPLLAGAAVGLLGFGAAMAVVAVAVAVGAAVAVPRFPALAADAAGTP